MIFGSQWSDTDQSISKVGLEYETNSFETIVFADFISNIDTFSIPPKLPNSHIGRVACCKLYLFLLLISSIKKFWCLLHLLGEKEAKKAHLLYTYDH